MFTFICPLPDHSLVTCCEICSRRSRGCQPSFCEALESSRTLTNLQHKRRRHRQQAQPIQRPRDGTFLHVSPLPHSSSATIATLLAYFTMALLSYYFGKKHYPIPYNLQKILFYLVLSISLSSISFYGFRDNLLVGILCVLIMNLVILLKEKTRIINLLKFCLDYFCSSLIVLASSSQHLFSPLD